MKIEIKKETEVKILKRVTKYCCLTMEELHNRFHILSIDEKGSLFLTASTEAGYGFREKMVCCPFCYEKIEVVEG